MIEALVAAEIPVMGHLGLTPQSVHTMGGYKVQAKEAAAAEPWSTTPRHRRGGVLRRRPRGGAGRGGAPVTEEVDVPTIGIGAGPGCDGQVLVFHDLLGLGGPPPKFVRSYADLARSPWRRSRPGPPTSAAGRSPRTPRPTTAARGAGGPDPPGYHGCRLGRPGATEPCSAGGPGAVPGSRGR